jgi:Brp/Blh family beta-carotene 15,15'-monooxygenase
MKNIENSGKAVGLLIAAVYLLFFRGNQVFEWVLIGSVLLTVGIPHGSIDHLLTNPNLNKNGLLNFILKYIGIILCYILIWILLPVPALIIFLLMSAYHFGQSHFLNVSLTYHQKSTYFFTGVFYLSVILWGDYSNTALILNTIAPVDEYEIFGWPVILASFSISNFLVFKSQSGKGVLLMIEMVFLGTLLYYLPLLVGFILYFGFWHALPSMNVEYKALKKHFSKKPFTRFVGKMVPFTAISIVGIVLVIALLYPRSEPEELVLLFFVLISLISAPHVWFMNRFLEAKKMDVNNSLKP